MGKVLSAFSNGFPGAVSRSVDDIIISVKNTGDTDIDFGAPVFLYAGGARGFNTASPQSFSSFMGFASRAAAKTPETYVNSQVPGEQPPASWKAGEVMEVLVRGSITLPCVNGGHRGDPLYIRISDGKLTALAGSSGSTVQLENVRLRNPCDSYSGCCEAVVTSGIFSKRMIRKGDSTGWT